MKDSNIVNQYFSEYNDMWGKMNVMNIYYKSKKIEIKMDYNYFLDKKHRLVSKNNA